jgi:hypothetical protein
MFCWNWTGSLASFSESIWALSLYFLTLVWLCLVPSAWRRRSGAQESTIGFCYLFLLKSACCLECFWGERDWIFLEIGRLSSGAFERCDRQIWGPGRWQRRPIRSQPSSWRRITFLVGRLGPGEQRRMAKHFFLRVDSSSFLFYMKIIPICSADRERCQSKCFNRFFRFQFGFWEWIFIVFGGMTSKMH